MELDVKVRQDARPDLCVQPYILGEREHVYVSTNFVPELVIAFPLLAGVVCSSPLSEKQAYLI